MMKYLVSNLRQLFFVDRDLFLSQTQHKGHKAEPRAEKPFLKFLMWLLSCPAGAAHRAHPFGVNERPQPQLPWLATASWLADQAIHRLLDYLGGRKILECSLSSLRGWSGSSLAATNIGQSQKQQTWRSCCQGKRILERSLSPLSAVLAALRLEQNLGRHC